MGQSVFSLQVQGIPDDWDHIIEKNYNEKYYDEIHKVCDKIKKVSDNQDKIEKFVKFVESNSYITLSTLIKLGKMCGYLSPCASVINLYFDMTCKDAQESLKSFCKSEIATEISGFLTTILQTHLHEAFRNIEYDRIEFASDHCSTALAFVETTYEKGDLNRWCNTIELRPNGLHMLINILSITKIISDLHINIIESKFLEKEKIRIDTLLNNLVNLIIQQRKDSIIIITSSTPQRLKSPIVQNKFSSTIEDKFFNYNFRICGMSKDGTETKFNNYKNNVIEKWNDGLNNIIV